MIHLLARSRPFSALEAWAAVAALSALTFFSVRLLRKPLKPGPKSLFLAARLGAAALAFLSMWAPEFAFRRKARVPVALVLDASASMAAADAGGGKEPRSSAAAEAMDRRRSFFAGAGAPSFFRLGNRLESAEDWRAAPRAPASDFSLLAEAARSAPGLKAIFFFSDGRRGGGPDPLPRLVSLGVPVYTVGVGNPAAAPDLAVEEVRAPPFAFKNTEARLSARIRLKGLAPGRAVLRVTERGETVGRAEVSWTTEDILEATVSFRPSRTGLEPFEFRASPAAGETNLANNVQRFTTDVARDRRRVLYICGRPGPGYAFLRQQLKSDPTVELVTFVILRDMEDVLSVPDRELSLIPFPAQDQLLEGLPSFDAVIFEDFSFDRFGLGGRGMEALRRFVERGGGFLLLGSGDSFGPSSPYRGSALEPLLPFRFDAPPVGGPRVFRAEPSPAGRFLTAFDEEDAWSRSPFLDGPALFPGALRAGAVPLFSVQAERPVPWAAVLQAGRGRTMALASLTTWRWALGEAGEGRGSVDYVRFWSGALNWLTGGDDFRRVQLEAPAEAAPGDAVVLRAHVRDDARRPVSDADVRLEVRGPDGKPRAEKMSAAGEGEYVLSLEAPPGRLLLKARAFREGRLLGEAEAPLSSGGGWDEDRDVTPDFSALEAISRATGGRFTPLSGFDGAWAARALDDVSWETERRVSLDSSPWVAGLLILILLAEWAGRRLGGLP